MAKTREQAQKQRKVVKRGTLARAKKAEVTYPVEATGRLSKPAAGCDHVDVERIEGGYRIRGVGFALFAWDAQQMADTARFKCSTCEASTPLPGLIVKRGDHG